MSFTINTNIASLQAQDYLRGTTEMQAKTLNRVTSGLRIVSSGDDAAGLAIANGYRSDLAALTQGIRNANDGLSQLQTMDGGINNISQLLDRARSLASQSASNLFTGDRTTLNKEFQNIMGEIDRQAQAIGLQTGGTFANKLSVFVGGGRDTSASTTTSAAVTNGTITVDLTSATVDGRGLGLKAYSAAGNSSLDVAGLPAVNSGAAAFTINGGFGSVTVNVTTTGTASLEDLVSKINTSLAGATGSAQALSGFKAANFKAVVDGNSFKITANTDFAINSSDAGADALFGTSAANGSNVLASGAQTSSINFTAMNAADAQTITIAAEDAQGVAHQVLVAFTGATGTAATDRNAMVTAINTALQNSGDATLKAMVATGDLAGAQHKINFVGSSKFTVTVGAGTGTRGLQAPSVGSSYYSSANGTGSNLDISSADMAQAAVSQIGVATATLGAAQAAVGKGQNQLNYAVNLAQSEVTNISASESRIRDADLATEAANMTKAQILLQAGVAALAQANSAPQQVLTLLRG